MHDQHRMRSAPGLPHLTPATCAMAPTSA